MFITWLLTYLYLITVSCHVLSIKNYLISRQLVLVTLPVTTKEKLGSSVRFTPSYGFEVSETPDLVFCSYTTYCCCCWPKPLYLEVVFSENLRYKKLNCCQIHIVPHRNTPDVVKSFTRVISIRKFSSIHCFLLTIQMSVSDIPTPSTVDHFKHITLYHPAVFTRALTHFKPRSCLF